MKRQSPFKFLNAYDKEDRAIFFGRDQEIEELYEMAHESNLILVYGRSGTGKTSLLQCGLANRFERADWMDISIRRKDDINVSLTDALKKRAESQHKSKRNTLRDRLRKRRATTTGAAAAEVSGEPSSDSDNQHVKLLRELYTSHFKPVYLIFDQFEEVFILGDQEEQQKFYESISEILEQCTFCHLLFVMREESIAQLYDFERVVPELFDKRIRVEPLNRANAVDVVTNTTSKFGIGLSDESVAERIIETISSGKGRAELTYLQVFLDALYQEADPNNLVFTHELVEQLGGIEDVLSDFLTTQSNRIQAELEVKYPKVSERAMRNVLNSFVTLEGTKQPMVLETLRIPGLTREQIEFCVNRLDDARILSYADDRYELRHDAIAARIAESRSTVDLAFLEAVKLIKDRSKAFQTTRTYLSEGEISFVKAFDSRMENEGGLTDEEQEYVRASVREARRKRLKRLRQVMAVGAVLFLGLVAVVIMYFRSNTLQYDRLMGMGDSQFAKNSYTEAVNSYRGALAVKETDSASVRLDRALHFAEVYEGFTLLEERANSISYMVRLDSVGGWTYFEDCDSLIVARDLLNQALGTRISGAARDRVENKLYAVENDLRVARNDLERRADIIKKPGDALSLEVALEYYLQALEITPDHSVLPTRVEDCRQALQALQE